MSAARDDPDLRHLEPAVEVAHHGEDAPLYCVLLLLEDWTIQWVPNAEHQAFADMDSRTVTDDELPPWSLLAFDRCHGNSSSLVNHVQEPHPAAQMAHLYIKPGSLLGERLCRVIG